MRSYSKLNSPHLAGSNSASVGTSLTTLACSSTQCTRRSVRLLFSSPKRIPMSALIFCPGEGAFIFNIEKGIVATAVYCSESSDVLGLRQARWCPAKIVLGAR